ncbi:MAG: PBP1A family penicillin-binding protein [Acidobacteriota bacterium]
MVRKKKKNGEGKGTKKKRRSLKTRLLMLCLELALFALLIFSVYILVLYLQIISRFEGRIWVSPSKIYSDAQVLYPGQEVAESLLIEKMKRMGYSSVRFLPQHKGQYRVRKDAVEIYLRDFDYPLERVAGRKVRVSFSGGRVVEIVEIVSSRSLDILEIEPEILATFHGNIQEERTVVKLKDFPEHLLDAVVCAEDFRFYKHHGIDWRAILRAFWANLRRGKIVEGGSTITQQLVKNLYLSEERTYSRKIKEAIMSFILEARYPKDKIIEVYANEIYLGQRGSVSICGFGEASRFYFGKNVEDLNLSESAMLAGIIRSPGSYNPFANYYASIERRNNVLKLMLSRKMITKDEYERAIAFKPTLAHEMSAFRQAPYFVDFLKEQLLQLYSEEILQKEGLRIFTTLDPFMQSCAEKSVLSGLNILERGHPSLMKKKEKLETCLITIQPQTGNILAMLGGRDYRVTQFNRATQAKRQPGSLFKPFVYLAAFNKSQKMKNSDMTAATLLEDEPFEILSGGKLWRPENYDGTFRGKVLARDALENSINVPTVHMAEMASLNDVIETAKRCGIASLLEPLPSLALGSEEVTPLEIAEAYSVIASMGKRATPISIKDVVNIKGKVIEKKRIEVRQAVSAQAAYIITDMLKGAVERGTAKHLRDYGFYDIAAGKTGTTNDYRDSWFVGYTPQILTLVWTGFDSDESTGLSGAAGAMRIWAEYMKCVGCSYSGGDFALPSCLVYINIDAANGERAVDGCPEVRREIFIEGTEPRDFCHEHGLGLGNWFRKIFQKREDR